MDIRGGGYVALFELLVFVPLLSPLAGSKRLCGAVVSPHVVGALWRLFTSVTVCVVVHVVEIVRIWTCSGTLRNPKLWRICFQYQTKQR